MRIDRAQLLQEAGPYETTLKAYRDVRPDAVRHFGAESEQVRKIDDGINDCEEAVGE
ncbi:hypothetical protein M2266_005991 [Streptomyces sp. SPB162]|nr:hypothetical protein [Streptomyces sp. SPB162]